MRIDAANGERAVQEPHLAFFKRIAAMIRKRLVEDAGPTTGSGGSSDIDAAVRQVIGGAVDAGEVIDLFAGAGLDALGGRG